MSLYIFDKDGTLVRYILRYGIPIPPERAQDQLLMPGVFEKLEILREGGHAIAIATNQTGVAEGILTCRQAEWLVKNCAAKVGGVNAWRLSPYSPKAKPTLRGQPNPYARDDETLKPHPGMLFDLMYTLGYPPDHTFMVGDKKADRQAAQAAGVHFFSAKDFFQTG